MTMPEQLLIVDDEPQIIEVLTEHFEGRGYAIDTALSGHEALASAAARRPDAVLLDIRLPGIDGVEVLNRLHATDPGIPIVMLTANEDEQLANGLLRMGAFDYVAKPFDFGHLDEVVAAALLYGYRSRTDKQ